MYIWIKTQHDPPTPKEGREKQHPNQTPNICYLGFPASIRKQSNLSVTKTSYKTTNSNLTDSHLLPSGIDPICCSYFLEEPELHCSELKCSFKNDLTYTITLPPSLLCVPENIGQTAYWSHVLSLLPILTMPDRLGNKLHTGTEYCLMPSHCLETWLVPTYDNHRQECWIVNTCGGRPKSLGYEASCIALQPTLPTPT